MLLLTPQNSSESWRWRKSATVFQSQFYPFKINHSLTVFAYLWAELNVDYIFLKKQAKKTIFAPKIALRVECSDPARNPYFPADFLSACFRCSRLLRNCVKITVVYRFIVGCGESADQKKTQTISLNCGVTHSPGKIEYNCRYFIMTFRTQIHQKKFGKNGFPTLQGTMSHRPLTNTSSLKIAAA